MTAKNLTAPLASLNQEQLKRNRMDDDVTLDNLSLTCTLGGGTGGPGAKTVTGRQVNPNRPQTKDNVTFRRSNASHLRGFRLTLSRVGHRHL